MYNNSRSRFAAPPQMQPQPFAFNRQPQPKFQSQPHSAANAMRGGGMGGNMNGAGAGLGLPGGGVTAPEQAMSYSGSSPYGAAYGTAAQSLYANTNANPQGAPLPARTKDATLPQGPQVIGQEPMQGFYGQVDAQQAAQAAALQQQAMVGAQPMPGQPVQSALPLPGMDEQSMMAARLQKAKLAPQGAAGMTYAQPMPPQSGGMAYAQPWSSYGGQGLL